MEGGEEEVGGEGGWGWTVACFIDIGVWLWGVNGEGYLQFEAIHIQAQTSNYN